MRFLGRSTIILAIMAVLFCSSLLIKDLVLERQARLLELSRQIGAVWGKPKTIAGPVVFAGDEYIQADSATIYTDLKADIRRKGIFSLPLYTASTKIEGTVAGGRSTGKPYALSVLLSDTEHIQNIQLKWNDRAIPIRKDESKCGTMTALIPEASIRESNTFVIEMSYSGIESLSFVPAAKATKATVVSNWKDPSFIGSLLPTTREITSTGFRADWDLSVFFKPQSASIPGIEGDHFSFGARLFIPADIYQKTERSIKYAVLFFMLTFVFIVMFEILKGFRVHPLQYLQVGAALVVFYLLLLSLSEKIGFPAAYSAASLATAGLIGMYCGKVLKSAKNGSIMTVLIMMLYGILYVLLCSEDYALLLGSGVLFSILAAIMFLTRSIDWYHFFAKDKRPLP